MREVRYATYQQAHMCLNSPVKFSNRGQYSAGVFYLKKTKNIMFNQTNHNTPSHSSFQHSFSHIHTTTTTMYSNFIFIFYGCDSNEIKIYYKKLNFYHKTQQQTIK